MRYEWYIITSMLNFLFPYYYAVLIFLKKRFPLVENKVSSVMLIISAVDSIIVTILQSLAVLSNGDEYIEIISFLNKIDFCLLIIFLNGILIYTLFITNKFKEEKDYYKILNRFLIFDFILAIIIMFLNVEVISINGNYSVAGSAITFTYIVCGFYILAAILTA